MTTRKRTRLPAIPPPRKIPYPKCGICGTYQNALIAMSLDPLVIVFDICRHVLDVSRPFIEKPRRTV